MTQFIEGIAKDESQTWKYFENIETDQDCWCFNTSVHFPDDEHILVRYYVGDQNKVKDRSVTQVAQLNKNWEYKLC